MQTMKHVSKGSVVALKPRADVAGNPKEEYQWPRKKDLRSSKIVKTNFSIKNAHENINQC